MALQPMMIVNISTQPYETNAWNILIYCRLKMYRIYQTDLCHGSFRRSYILFIDEPVKWYVFPIHVGHVWHWTTIVSTIIPHCQQMGSGKKCHLVWMTMRIRLRHRWYVVILGHSIVQATMPLSSMQQFNRSELICLPSIRHTLIFTYPIYHITQYTGKLWMYLVRANRTNTIFHTQWLFGWYIK